MIHCKIAGSLLQSLEGAELHQVVLPVVDACHRLEQSIYVEHWQVSWGVGAWSWSGVPWCILSWRYPQTVVQNPNPKWDHNNVYLSSQLWFYKIFEGQQSSVEYHLEIHTWYQSHPHKGKKWWVFNCASTFPLYEELGTASAWRDSLSTDCRQGLLPASIHTSPWWS